MPSNHFEMEILLRISLRSQVISGVVAGFGVGDGAGAGVGDGVGLAAPAKSGSQRKATTTARCKKPLQVNTKIDFKNRMFGGTLNKASPQKILIEYYLPLILIFLNEKLHMRGFNLGFVRFR
jgi:hypothetical protein